MDGVVKVEPADIGIPPVGLSNQRTVPSVAVAVKVAVPVPQIDTGTVELISGI